MHGYARPEVFMRLFSFLPLLLALGTLVLGMVTFDAPAAASTDTDVAVDVTLESSRGGNRALSTYRGKVVVLFYEDRHHTETNARIKEAVARYGQEHKLQDKVEVVAVANLKGYDFSPASNIARRAIKAIASKVGIEILMDWRGDAVAPLGVQDANANVVVIDRAGVIRYRITGRLHEGDEKALLAAVSASL
jgi:peroxiredoxin